MAGGSTPTSQEPTSATDPAPAAGALSDLRQLGQLRDLFNAKAGAPRLILLLSPT